VCSVADGGQSGFGGRIPGHDLQGLQEGRLGPSVASEVSSYARLLQVQLTQEREAEEVLRLPFKALLKELDAHSSGREVSQIARLKARRVLEGSRRLLAGPEVSDQV
jgi:hypothetical protein